MPFSPGPGTAEVAVRPVPAQMWKRGWAAALARAAYRALQSAWRMSLCCLLHIARGMLPVARGTWHVARGMVACCTWHVARGMLHLACCMLHRGMLHVLA